MYVMLCGFVLYIKEMFLSIFSASFTSVDFKMLKMFGSFSATCHGFHFSNICTSSSSSSQHDFYLVVLSLKQTDVLQCLRGMLSHSASSNCHILTSTLQKNINILSQIPESL